MDLNNLWIDHNGNVRSYKQPKETNAEILERFAEEIDLVHYGDKGFTGRLFTALNGKDCLDSVRIKSVYIPFSGDLVKGSPACYIELENNGPYEFPLDGCYVHLAKGDQVKHLELRGVIRSNETYVIQGKVYEEPGLSEIDIEWAEYNELLDFAGDGNYSISVTYGLEDLQASYKLERTTKGKKVYSPNLIAAIKVGSSSALWSSAQLSTQANSILIQETDKLGLGIREDVSGWVNINTPSSDFGGYIGFPHSPGKLPIYSYSPSPFEYSLGMKVLSTCGLGNSRRHRCITWVEPMSTGEEYELWISPGNDEWFLSTDEEHGWKIITPDNEMVYGEKTIYFSDKVFPYRSRKCVLQFSEVTEPKEFKYQVCPVEKVYNEETGDYTKRRLSWLGDIYSLYIFPDDYDVEIIEVSGPKGYDWVEYQVWAASVREIATKVKKDGKYSVIVVIGGFVNNGSRHRDWEIMIESGRELWETGCPMIFIPGTVEDMVHFDDFFTSEPEEDLIPCFGSKYIPGFPVVSLRGKKIVGINTVLTRAIQKELGAENVNIYTGWNDDMTYNTSFTPIYNILYQHFLRTGPSQSIIPFGSDSPFSYSKDDVVSAINNDVKSPFWLPRLLEYFDVDTYFGGCSSSITSVSKRVRERYCYDSDKDSMINGKMDMNDTLKNDTAEWKNGRLEPIIDDSGIKYITLEATGMGGKEKHGLLPESKCEKQNNELIPTYINNDELMKILGIKAEGGVFNQSTYSTSKMNSIKV